MIRLRSLRAVGIASTRWITAACSGCQVGVAEQAVDRRQPGVAGQHDSHVWCWSSGVRRRPSRPGSGWLRWRPWQGWQSAARRTRVGIPAMVAAPHRTAPLLSSGPEGGEHRQHPPVVVLLTVQAQLAEDVRDVALDGLERHREPVGDRRCWSDPRPSAPARLAPARRAARLASGLVGRVAAHEVPHDLGVEDRPGCWQSSGARRVRVVTSMTRSLSK